MSILFFKSSVNVDGNTNGGSISLSRITDGTLQNVIPNVSQTDRANGLTRYRKVFAKLGNATVGSSLNNSYAYLVKPAAGDDYISISPGTSSDTQADIGGYSWQGVGSLNAVASAGDSSITVESPYSGAFQVGDKVIISTINAGTYESTKNETFIAGTVTWTASSSVHTIGVSAGSAEDGGDDLRYSYVTANTYVSSMASVGTLTTSAFGFGGTLALPNTFDETVTTYNIGTVDDDWTLTFTTSSTFSATGSVTGNLSGTYSTTADAQPAHGTSYYWKIDSDSWYIENAGNVGETVTFTTRNYTAPVWVRQVVPSGSSAYYSDNFVLGIYGD